MIFLFLVAVNLSTDTVNKLCIYFENFEQVYISSAVVYYTAKASALFNENEIQNYMKYVRNTCCNIYKYNGIILNTIIHVVSQYWYMMHHSLHVVDTDWNGSHNSVI